MATFTPAANGDDLKIQVNTGIVDGNGSTFGDGGGSPYLYDTYVRFRSVSIPKEATILTAKLTLTANGNYSNDNCNVNIYGNNVDNASVPGSISAYNALALTDPVAWNAVAHITTNTAFDSPSIVDIIQTIVNRSGWSSGNALAILLKNNSSSTSANRNCYTYNDGNSNYYPKLVVTYLSEQTGEISETITFSEVESSWNSPERVDESLTFNDATGGGFEATLAIAENINFNEVINFLWDMYITEGLTLAEVANVEWDFTVSEGLTLADVMECPYWFEVISEALTLTGIGDVENRNVTWREERSINMVGEHIQLLFRNNEVEEGLYLRDIKVYLDRMEDRKAIEAGDYVGEHVRFKFRNNVADEGFYLEYVRIIAIFRGLLGWQV